MLTLQFTLMKLKPNLINKNVTDIPMTKMNHLMKYHFKNLHMYSIKVDCIFFSIKKRECTIELSRLAFAFIAYHEFSSIKCPAYSFQVNYYDVCTCMYPNTDHANDSLRLVQNIWFYLEVHAFFHH